ncbi:unnamed protein product [Heterobilharzia americana]|nr:unnamed protein product [Heterobilharzia americana]
MLHHPEETKRCAELKITTGTGWLDSGSPDHVRIKLKHYATHHHRTEHRMTVNSQTHLNFMDFEKALDSVDREVIWQAAASTLRNNTNLYQPHSTTILPYDATCHMPSNSQWEAQ